MVNSDIDRRRAERFQTLNLLSYFERDISDFVVSQGIAKTLDLSENGALIEIPAKLVHLDNVTFEIALEEQILKVKPEVLDQSLTAQNTWKVRVRFPKLRPADHHRLAVFIHSLQ